MDELKQKLSVQVTTDFKQSFTSGFVYSTTNDIGDICRVISVLEPTVKADLTKWFIDQQLSEYFVLYADSEDLAWIDRIDMRFVISGMVLIHNCFVFQISLVCNKVD